jgi:hypothetical protein
MKWQEIRTYFPQQWLLVEAIQARTESDKRILEQLAVIGVFDDSAAAESSYRQLHRQAPERELYVFHTSQQTLDAASGSTGSQKVDKRDIDKPTGVEIAGTRDRVKISWKHVGFGAQLVALLWFMPMCDLVVANDRWNFLHKSLIPIAIMALFTLYYCLIWLNNKMVVQVDRTTLEINWKGPVPCFYPGRTFPVADIKQVYVRRLSRHTNTTYDIYILTTQGQHKKFATVNDGKRALYLEQEIERFLGIEDQAVRGEWRPGPYLWES